MDVALAVKPGIKVPNLPCTKRVDSDRGTLLLWLDIDNWSEKNEDCRTIMNLLAELIGPKGYSDDYRYVEIDGMDNLISGGWIDNPFNLGLELIM